MNCTSNRHICNKYKMKKMPTVLIVKRDKTRVRFTKELNSV